MKVLISADMEGTCGVVSWVQVMPPEVVGAANASLTEYERGRARMTAEVNAAVAGAFNAGATEVYVNDSHDGMRNILIDQLDPRAILINGKDKQLGMVQGLELGIDALLLTGFHAKAGTPAAPLAHTWTTSLNDMRFNGVSTGEFGLAAAIAGYYGTPIVFVTGDDKAVAQTRAFVGEDQVVGVPTKEGITTFSALHLHPLTAQNRIQAGVESALANLASAKPYQLPDGCEVQLDFDHQSRADAAASVPGVRRVGERTVAWNPTDGNDLGYTFIAIMEVASIRMSP